MTNPTATAGPPTWHAPWVAILVTLATGVILTVVISAWLYGSAAATWAAWRGKTVFLEHETVSFGVGEVDRRFLIPVRLTNLSGNPVRIVGSETTCGCLVSEELPVTINAHSSKSLNILVRPNQVSEDFRQKVWFYTNQPEEQTVQVEVVGVIHAAAEVRAAEPDVTRR